MSLSPPISLPTESTAAPEESTTQAPPPSEPTTRPTPSSTQQQPAPPDTTSNDDNVTTSQPSQSPPTTTSETPSTPSTVSDPAPPATTTSQQTQQQPNTSLAPAPVVATTLVVTQGNGERTTLISTLPYAAVNPTDTSSPQSSGNNHGSKTGAIVGGVLGAIAGFIALLALGYWAWRRHQRRKSLDNFDGNFDPAAGNNRMSVSGLGSAGVKSHTTGGTLPDIRLDDEEAGYMGGRRAGSEVPFNPYQGPGSPEMRQMHALPPIIGVPFGSLRGPGSPPPGSQYSSSAHGHGQQLSYEPGSPPMGVYSSGTPSSPSTSASALSYSHYPPYPMPLPDRTGSASPPHSFSNSTGTGHSSNKEREAYPVRRVVNPDMGPSSQARGYPPTSHTGSRRVSSGAYSQEAHQAYLANGPGGPTSAMYGGRPASGVWVHTDGGRVGDSSPPEQEEGGEIPPTYDSIPGNSSSNSPRAQAVEKGRAL